MSSNIRPSSARHHTVNRVGSRFELFSQGEMANSFLRELPDLANLDLIEPCIPTGLCFFHAKQIAGVGL